MTDTIQRWRNTEAHRVSCNVGIGGGVQLRNLFFEGENSTFAFLLISFLWVWD